MIKGDENQQCHKRLWNPLGRLCTHVGVHICVFTSKCECMCVCVLTCVLWFFNVYVFMRAHMCMYVHMCMCVYSCACVYLCACVFMCLYVHLYMCVHVCTHVFVPQEHAGAPILKTGSDALLRLVSLGVWPSCVLTSASTHPPSGGASTSSPNSRHSL